MNYRLALRVIKRLGLSLGLIGAAPAWAESFKPSSNLRLLEGEYVGFEAGYIDHLRDPYMPEYNTGSGGEEWRHSAALLGDINLIRYKEYKLYVKNRWHMTTTTNQVRHVGWRWELGLTIIPDKIDVFYRHHSQHVMEAKNPNSRFPVLDEYVVRFDFYRRK